MTPFRLMRELDESKGKVFVAVEIASPLVDMRAFRIALDEVVGRALFQGSSPNG